VPQPAQALRLSPEHRLEQGAQQERVRRLQVSPVARQRQAVPAQGPPWVSVLQALPSPAVR
jgi:hypothetical protein